MYIFRNGNVTQCRDEYHTHTLTHVGLVAGRLVLYKQSQWNTKLHPTTQIMLLLCLLSSFAHVRTHTLLFTGCQDYTV